MANAIDILNTARVEAGYEDRIPVINQENLHNLSLLSPTEQNDFLNIIAKIVKQVVYDTTYDSTENPFAEFFSEKLPVGSTVEDLYVDLITGATPAWDDDGSYALSKKAPNVKAIYHSENYEMQYKVSTSYAQMKSAFLTMGGFDSLVNRIKGTLNSSAQYDLYLQCLELISTAFKRGVFQKKFGYSLDTEDGIKNYLKDLKTTYKDMQFMTNKYNYFHMLTKSSRDNIVIITKPKYLEKINVDYLAGVFNLSQAELNARIIEVPDDYGFGSYDNETNPIIALMFDKRMLRIFPTLYEGSAIYNPASLVDNTFLTLAYIFSYGLFFNAVAFVGGTDATTQSITGEAPSTVTVFTAAGQDIKGKKATNAAFNQGKEVAFTWTGTENYKATVTYTGASGGTETEVYTEPFNLIMPLTNDFKVVLTKV